MPRTTYLQDGERFVRIALTAPGTVRLRSVEIDFAPFPASPADDQGVVSLGRRSAEPDLLHRRLHAAARHGPPGTQNGNPEPAVVDGAKRDRAIWSGDLVVEGPGIWTTLGAGGAAYVKQSLLALARAADAMVDYFRYTGDRDFARQALPVVEKQLAFIASGLDDRGPLRHHRGRAGPARGGR